MVRFLEQLKKDFSGNKPAALIDRENKGALLIPVVVHVLHNESNNTIGKTNISDWQIISQINRFEPRF